MDAIYRVDGQRVVPSSDAAGPWDAGMQHGSAPAALAVWAAEAIPAAMPMEIARVTIDLMQPVPVAPLTLQSEVLREGARSSFARSGFCSATSSSGRRHHPEGQAQALHCRPASATGRSSFPDPISR